MKNLEIMSIVNAYTAKKEAIRNGEQADLRLPARIAWTRRVNMAKLFQAKKIIDEAMQELNERYADDEHSEETDGTRTVKPEYREEYFKQQGEILTQDTDVDVRRISVEALDGMELTDMDMDTLAFMLED